MLLYNQELIDTIFKNELILDGFLIKIELSFESDLKASFVIRKGRKTLNLFCESVRDFMFTCPNAPDYLIPSFKLFKEESNRYYLCFDPVSEVNEREDDDTDYLVFESLYADVH